MPSIVSIIAFIDSKRVSYYMKQTSYWNLERQFGFKEQTFLYFLSDNISIVILGYSLFQKNNQLAASIFFVFTNHSSVNNWSKVLMAAFFLSSMQFGFRKSFEVVSIIHVLFDCCFLLKRQIVWPRTLFEGKKVSKIALLRNATLLASSSVNKN